VQQSLPPHTSVLLVEDDPINGAVTRLLLEQLGCETTMAGNGREALARLRERSFDIVLMDCRMPVMDGYAATAAIRRIERDTGRRQRIIALTARAMPGDRETCIAAGMDEYLPKPFSLEVLRGVLVEQLVGPAPEPSRTSGTAPAADAEADEQVFDDRALQDISADDGGTAVIARVLDRFRQQAPNDVAALCEAAARESGYSVAGAIAHRLKSSAGFLGGRHLAALCRDIEAAAYASKADEVRALAKRLPDELAALLAALASRPKGSSV